MTPQETQQLQSLAVSTLTDVSAFAAVTLFHGIFTLLFAISTAIFLRRGLKTRASWTMFAITIVTYTLSTMYWASDFAVIVYSLKPTLIDQSDLELAAKLRVMITKMEVANWVSIWTSTLPPLISDAVVIWRAWVLFPERRWVVMPSVAMLFGTTACTLAFNLLRLAPNGNGRINGNLFGSSIILSLCTNAVTTALIAYKLWSLRRFVVKDLGLTQGRSAVQRVLDIMVESGFSYCTLQIITVTLDSLPDAPILGKPLAYAVQVLLCSYTVLSAMYPTLVIVLINSQRSIVDTYGFSTALNEKMGTVDDRGARPATAGHLSFAVGVKRCWICYETLFVDGEMDPGREATPVSTCQNLTGRGATPARGYPVGILLDHPDTGFRISLLDYLGFHPPCYGISSSTFSGDPNPSCCRRDQLMTPEERQQLRYLAFTILLYFFSHTAVIFSMRN
ncbi:hypothetical protein LshimejAT787_0100690 [Lyophyllum shimeji]|uniref:Transmembrane protein n=1 Tax=Lyophyllum shimeji TaxID=47721 RepID=A0A9P3PCP0_LYOSH|nr:hypothetical protein LshimejAT787_0100690 [Lyophyllum shimeji]